MRVNTLEVGDGGALPGGRDALPRRPSYKGERGSEGGWDRRIPLKPNRVVPIQSGLPDTTVTTR